MKSLKVLLSMAFLLTVFLALNGKAQAADMKIAYVDLSRIFDEYGKTKEYDAVLEKKHSEYEAARNKKLDKIKDEQNKLSLLKEEEKAKLQEDMDKDRADLLEFDRQQQTDLRKQRDEKIREILLEIEKIVRGYAEKEKLSLVLNDKVLIYGGKEMDITEKILKMLNETYKK